MLSIEYKIINSDYDEFNGQNGFFLIKINEKEYGEMYEGELAEVMGTEDLSYWFKSLLEIIVILSEKNYIAWSDIESYCSWLEFVKRNDKVYISLKDAVKPFGTQFLEEKLEAPENGEWVDEEIDYVQMSEEIIAQASTYLKYIKDNNEINNQITRLEALLDKAKKLDLNNEKTSSLKNMLKQNY